MMDRGMTERPPSQDIKEGAKKRKLLRFPTFWVLDANWLPPRTNTSSHACSQIFPLPASLTERNKQNAKGTSLPFTTLDHRLCRESPCLPLAMALSCHFLSPDLPPSLISLSSFSTSLRQFHSPLLTPALPFPACL